MSDKKTITIPLFCDALIDQGRYIGDDPVGYSCMREAVTRVGGFDLCARCAAMLIDEPDRIMLPQVPGRVWAPGVLKNLLTNLP